MVSISITAAQLVGKVSIEGADEGQTSLKNVGQAADTLGQKLESVKPFDASKTITDVDVAEARFTLLQEKVKQAQQALQEMQDASARGEKVEGIESAEANLTILQAKAQEAGAAMYDLSISELAADTAAKETAFTRAKVAHHWLSNGANYFRLPTTLPGCSWLWASPAWATCGYGANHRCL